MNAGTVSGSRAAAASAILSCPFTHQAGALLVTAKTRKPEQNMRVRIREKPPSWVNHSEHAGYAAAVRIANDFWFAPALFQQGEPCRNYKQEARFCTVQSSSSVREGAAMRGMLAVIVGLTLGLYVPACLAD